jgi:subtilisin family serine protease
MAAGGDLRQFVVVAAQFVEPLPSGELIEGARHLLEQYLDDPELEYEVVAIPSHGWIRYTYDGHTTLPDGDMVIALRMPSGEAVDAFRSAAARANERSIVAGNPPVFVRGGADLVGGATEYFCPANLDQLLFADRAAARRLIHADHLRQRGLRGAGVNIVVIDHGFDRQRVTNFGGGWAQQGRVPGTTTHGHGVMVVRNICDIAPDATFWDLPLIPLAIDNVEAFLATALPALQHVLDYITGLPRPGPWVLVNPWAIFDRARESHLGDYTENRQLGGHDFNNLIGQAAGIGIDIVFGAGNCGQFCPDRRCGVLDRGPGSSIWGANSHRDVITAGAVRADARWLGNSSQGRGQPLLGLNKPDFCAPSNFRDGGDAFTGSAQERPGYIDQPYVANTGTSAACGVAAGVVAALRGLWGPVTVPAGATLPGALIPRLNATARATEGPGWKRHLGHGVIDAEAAFQNLDGQFPAAQGPYP